MREKTGQVESQAGEHAATVKAGLAPPDGEAKGLESEAVGWGLELDGRMGCCLDGEVEAEFAEAQVEMQ